MSDSRNFELKARATTLVLDRRWDFFLCTAYLEIKEFFPDKTYSGCIESCISDELKNISSDIVFHDWGEKYTDFFVANFKSLRFKIGCCYYTSSVFCINLIIEEKLVLSIVYKRKDNRELLSEIPPDADDYTAISVEVLHLSPQIALLLEGLTDLFKRHKLKHDDEYRKQQSESYEGKFTFGDE